MTTCARCGVAFEPKRPHARFCSDACRAIDWRENSGEDAGERVHGLDEARARHEESKGKWTVIVREHLNRTLLETGFVSAEDFDALGIPDEHRNLANAQMGAYSRQGFMEPVSWRRSTKASRKSGKIWTHRITELGRQKLTATSGVGAGGSLASRDRAGVDPGGGDSSAAATSPAPTVEEAPARLFDEAPARPLNPLVDSEAA